MLEFSGIFYSQFLGVCILWKFDGYLHLHLFNFHLCKISMMLLKIHSSSDLLITFPRIIFFLAVSTWENLMTTCARENRFLPMIIGFTMSRCTISIVPANLINSFYERSRDKKKSFQRLCVSRYLYLFIHVFSCD